MSHIVKRSGIEYMEYDNAYTGEVVLTYQIKADQIEDAEGILDSIAAALQRTGVIGMTDSCASAKLTNTDSRKVNQSS